VRESDLRKSNPKFNFALVTETLTDGISDNFYETISVLTAKKKKKITAENVIITKELSLGTVCSQRWKLFILESLFPA
jgi:hypothetical protein